MEKLLIKILTWKTINWRNRKTKRWKINVQWKEIESVRYSNVNLSFILNKNKKVK